MDGHMSNELEIVICLSVPGVCRTCVTLSPEEDKNEMRMNQGLRPGKRERLHVPRYWRSCLQLAGPVPNSP
jgi:hypothetical protein